MNIPTNKKEKISALKKIAEKIAPGCPYEIEADGIVDSVFLGIKLDGSTLALIIGITNPKSIGEGSSDQPTYYLNAIYHGNEYFGERLKSTTIEASKLMPDAIIQKNYDPKNWNDDPGFAQAMETLKWTYYFL